MVFGIKSQNSHIRQHYLRALSWVKNNSIPEQGVVVSSQKKTPYLAVTGYLIPTLLEAGEINWAYRYARYLTNVQQPSGAFAGPDGKDYVFDTAQALRGLIAANERWPEFEPFMLKAAEYIFKEIQEDGRISARYEDVIPEEAHLYALAPLLKVADLKKRQDIRQAVEKALRYYKRAEVLNSKHLTHFSAYVIDGFIELGEANFVRSFVERIFKSQRRDGSLPAFEGVSWVCVVGVAQYAVIAYKLGMTEQADSAVRYLCSVQNRNGGFAGSLGYKAMYFFDQEISWANKFFLDAIHCKINEFFNKHASIFPSVIAEHDGRLTAIVEALGNLNGKKVLDVGCGKGRFAARLKQLFPAVELMGIDISEELLRDAAHVMPVKCSSMLNLPFKDGEFDAVISVEAIEHCLNPELAVAEMARVIKAEGKIVLIDKNLTKTGRLKTADFEQWFSPPDLCDVLAKYFYAVKSDFIRYDQNDADGLFIAWQGTRGLSTLSANDWSVSIRAFRTIDDIRNHVLSHKYPDWVFPLITHTKKGDEVLELGSGTGEMAAIMANYQRQMTLMDFSDDNIDLAKNIFQKLGFKGSFYIEDVLQKWSFNKGQFDWVYSSGLLEHFSDQQIQEIMRQSALVARKGVMCLVPNANALLYRMGKFAMEQDGTWADGYEDPKFTMRPFFEKAGLVNIEEFSVGPYQAMNFLDYVDPAIKKFFDHLTVPQLQQLNQGYLLFTYGEKVL